MSYRISKFRLDKLGRYTEIFPGFAFKSNRFTDNPADVALVKGENVRQGFVDWSASKYWPATDADSSEKFELRAGDVVLAMDRPWVTAGLKWAYIKKHDSKALLVQRVSRLRAKNGLNQTYLRCLISSRYFSDYIQPIVTGVNVPHISGKQIGGFEAPLPAPQIQQKIAAIISAYDEMIENNKRRIVLLEKLAEEIYREWFVRLRFPGHEKVKLVKGVPHGWRVVELSELAAVNPSSISRRDKPDSILYVDISSVSPNRINEVTPYASADAPGRARRRVKHGDVIWSSVRPANRAYCLIYDPPENLIVSTGFAVIRPNAAAPFTFVFFAVTSNSFVDQMTTVAKGAAYPATSFDDFEKAKVLVPTDDLLKSFHQKAEPLFRHKHLLQRQSERLKQIRDILLPRLISGKLSVENLDIQLPFGMAEESNAKQTETAHA
jgi:type I restriction enzyme, S subunit